MRRRLLRAAYCSGVSLVNENWNLFGISLSGTKRPFLLARSAFTAQGERALPHAVRTDKTYRSEDEKTDGLFGWISLITAADLSKGLSV